MSDIVYLDDIKVGDTFESREYEVTAEEIKEYANKYDPQIFHLDEEKAKDTFFKGLAASGWHTVSITMRLLVETIKFSKGTIGAGAQLDWPTPTRPGDFLKAKSIVKEIKRSKSKPSQAIVTLENEITNQDGEVRLILTTKVLAFDK